MTIAAFTLTKPAACIAAGMLLIGSSAVLHFVVLLRMRDVGQAPLASLLLEGGTFDYHRYLKIRQQHGWSATPVLMIPVTLLLGMGLLVFGISQLP